MGGTGRAQPLAQFKESNRHSITVGTSRVPRPDHAQAGRVGAQLE